MKPLHLPIFSTSSILAGLGLESAIAGPDLKRIEIPIKNLKEDLVGLKIVQISDLHVGPTIRSSYVEKVVAIANSANADFIAITGDLADGKVEFLRTALRPLKKLNCKTRVFYILGNHEFYWGAQDFVRWGEEMGFRVLFNENEILKIGSSQVLICGISDPAGENTGKGPDLEAALRTSTPVDLKILLAHRPNSLEEFEDKSCDLQLSGHTHGGQFFPANLLVAMVQRYNRGFYKKENLNIYVNSGTGYWGPASRLFIPSEVTLLELTRA